MSSDNRTDDFFQNFKSGLEDIGKKMSNLVDDVFSGDVAAGEVRAILDAYEAQGQYVIEIELPGVTKEHVSIQVQDGVLHIRGKKIAPTPEGDAVYDRSERSFGAFRRDVALPPNVQLENIKAKYESGVLIVRFPLTQVEDQDSEISID